MRTWEELKEKIYSISMVLSILFIILLIVSIGATLLLLSCSYFGYAWLSFIVVCFTSFMLYYLDKVTDLLNIGVFK